MLFTDAIIIVSSQLNKKSIIRNFTIFGDLQSILFSY
jgi:hypothetical protein